MRNPPIEQLLAKVENKLKYIRREIFVFSSCFLIILYAMKSCLIWLKFWTRSDALLILSLFLNWNQIGIFLLYYIQCTMWSEKKTFEFNNFLMFNVFNSLPIFSKNTWKRNTCTSIRSVTNTGNVCTLYRGKKCSGKVRQPFFSWKVHILGFQKVTNFDNVSKPDSQEIFQSRDIATKKIKYRWLMWSQKRWQFLYKIQTLIIRTYS